MAGRTPGTKRRTTASNRSTTHRGRTAIRRATFSQVIDQRNSLSEIVAQFNGMVQGLSEESPKQYTRQTITLGGQLVRQANKFVTAMTGWNQNRAIGTGTGAGQGRAKAATAGR